jgi:cytochrome c553
MGRLDRRLESLEARRKRRGNQPGREALSHLSDEDLDALEEALLAEARARGEQPPPTNELLEKMKRWEAEAIEQQRRRTEESRRRAKKGAPQ